MSEKNKDQRILENRPRGDDLPINRIGSYDQQGKPGPYWYEEYSEDFVKREIMPRIAQWVAADKKLHYPFVIKTWVLGPKTRITVEGFKIKYAKRKQVGSKRVVAIVNSETKWQRRWHKAN